MMITYEQAVEKVLKNALVLPIEKALIEDSAGRILAEDIQSGIFMPPFDKSAVDGYAVNASDVKRISARLKRAGIIHAGEAFGRRLARGECVKIMTGAPMPKGADSVVMVEDSRQQGEYVELFKTAEKGENVCRMGEDIRKGQRILSKGAVLSPARIGLLATIGLSRVKVVSKPAVAVMNTGEEIVSAGDKLGKNKIYNSNGPQIMSMLKKDGIESVYLGIAKDKPQELKRLIREGLKQDILLISGGVSMGDYDLVPKILKESGVKEIFHKVKVKPGKPLFFGIKGKTLVFGVPGNPVSNFTTYLLFIRIAIRKMSGYKTPIPYWQEGILDDSFKNLGDRLHFVPVKIKNAGGRLTLNPVNSHGSADALSLSKAQGFMMIEAGRCLKKGEKVKFGFIENYEKNCY